MTFFLRYYYRYSARLIGLLLLLAVAGCAQSPVLIVEKTADQVFDRQVFDTLFEWQMAGRLSVRYQQQAWLAKMSWLQRGEDYKISLYSMTGQVLALLQRRAGRVTLETPKTSLTGEHAQQLIEQTLGILLPTDNLRYWLLGMSSSLAGEAQLVWDKGRLRALDQGGWHVDYLTYRYFDAPAYVLPKKIRLNVTQGEGHVRIVVDSWHFGASL